MSLYAVPGVDHGEQYSPLVREVMALLAMAPRAGGAAWGGTDLLTWVDLTSRVEPAEVESALTWVRLWGAQGAELVPAATHVVLTRNAPQGRTESERRARRHVEGVCTYLRAHLSNAVAAQLPQLSPEQQPAARDAVWAYFFASMAFLLAVLVLTR
jgi:hypothetical protein